MLTSSVLKLLFESEVLVLSDFVTSLSMYTESGEYVVPPITILPLPSPSVVTEDLSPVLSRLSYYVLIYFPEYVAPPITTSPLSPVVTEVLPSVLLSVLLSLSYYVVIESPEYSAPPITTLPSVPVEVELWVLLSLSYYDVIEFPEYSDPPMTTLPDPAEALSYLLVTDVSFKTEFGAYFAPSIRT